MASNAAAGGACLAQHNAGHLWQLQGDDSISTCCKGVAPAPRGLLTTARRQASVGVCPVGCACFRAIPKHMHPTQKRSPCMHAAQPYTSRCQSRGCVPVPQPCSCCQQALPRSSPANRRMCRWVAWQQGRPPAPLPLHLSTPGGRWSNAAAPVTQNAAPHTIPCKAELPMYNHTRAAADGCSHPPPLLSWGVHCSMPCCCQRRGLVWSLLLRSCCCGTPSMHNPNSSPLVPSQPTMLPPLPPETPPSPTPLMRPHPSAACTWLSACR
jgi:hypothetical protein